jgi:coenzyme F420 biosynthesis associated uncharacterized protein
VSGSPRRTSGRLFGAGIALGVAAAGIAIAAGRRAESSARQGLVDWPTVGEIAEARLRRARGALSASEVAASDAAYAAAMRRVTPALEAHLGVALPGVVERAGAIDRAGWVHANVRVLARLFALVEGDVIAQILPPGVGGTRATIAAANRWATTRQVGLMLAFMGQRVLGQYDIALLAAEDEEPGRLIFVEENIRQTAKTLEVDLDAFRTWIALHEATHAFEFEAHPWLRPYLSDRMEAQLAAFSRDVRGMSRDVARSLAETIRGKRQGHWMEAILTDEQRRMLRETQAIMSLLEGFSDHVMDEVGRDIVPGHAAISAKFHRRRESRSRLERALLRITGLDMKMEQYRRGEEFVSALRERAGPDALRRIWESPETLPRDGEIEEPDRWIARVMRGEAPATAGSDATGQGDTRETAGVPAGDGDDGPA